MNEWLANLAGLLWLGVFVWLTPSFAAVVTRKGHTIDLWCALVWLYAVNRITFNAIRLWVHEDNMRQMVGDGWLLLSGATAVVSVLVVMHYRRRG